MQLHKAIALKRALLRRPSLGATDLGPAIANVKAIVGLKLPASLSSMLSAKISSTSVQDVLPTAEHTKPDADNLDPKTIALTAGVLGAVLLTAFAVRAGVGHYVGKRMGSKWGWFWGGVFGVPGLGGLALYRRGNR